MPPLLSIVISNYNYGRFLPRFFQALAAQTLDISLVEVIFVDDGSRDDSLATAEKLLRDMPVARYVVLEREHRGKPGLTRNAGLTRAEGDFLICLDPDDLPFPEHLEGCLGVLESNPDAELAYTDYVEAGEKAERIVVLPDFDPVLLATQNILSPTVMIRRSVWEGSRGYRDNTAYEDWEFWVQAAARGCCFARLNRPLYRYMIHDANFSLTARKFDGPAKAAIVGNNSSFFDPAVRRWAKALLRGEPWAIPFGRGIIPCSRDVELLEKMFRRTHAMPPASS